MDKQKEEMNTKAIAELKKEIEEIKAMLLAMKPTTDAIRETQVEISEVTKDTNTEAHKTKHRVEAFPNNMRGFTELTNIQYKQLNGVISEFKIVVAELRTQKEYTDEKLDLLEMYMGEIRAIVSTQLFRDMIEEMKESKLFRNKATWAAWLVLAAAALAAAVKGIIEAIKSIGGQFK